MTYVKFISWHVITITYRSGLIGTRCGRMARVEGTIAPMTSDAGLMPVRETSDTLPLDEKSCETCLRLSQRDEEGPDVPNDEVPG